MTPHITEQIRPLPVIPPSELEGPKLGSPEILVNDLVHYAYGSSSNREMISELLEPSGLTVKWTEGEDGWYIGSFPEGAHEAMVANLSEKQRQTREIYVTTNERLPEFKRSIVAGLVQYGRGLGIEDPDLEELFASRIANIDEVKIIAPLAQGNGGAHILRDRNAVAGLERKSGVLQIDVENIFTEVEETSLTRDEIISRSINHELEHGESVGALTNSGFWMAQSGIAVFPQRENGNRDWHGTLLLEEGTQEQIRWRHLDGVTPVYEKGVMFWEAMIAIDPKIEKLRFEAKFLGRNRGELIGSIESILGPHAVEELEDFWDTHLGILNYPEYKNKLVGMIDVYDSDLERRTAKTEAAKNIARQKLDETQSEILAQRGFNFTDDEMIQAKELGATAASQVREVLANA